jgi:hypothetical protein
MQTFSVTQVQQFEEEKSNSLCVWRNIPEENGSFMRRTCCGKVPSHKEKFVVQIFWCAR